MTRAAELVFEAGEARIQSAGNEEELERCRMKDGDVEGPWVEIRAGGVSPLS
jgi:hypothetical protein